MIEVIFLSALALIAIIFAIVQDVRTHEVSNWISFSLIIFALGFRFFYSLFFEGNFTNLSSFFYQGLIGLAIFFAIGNLFYYGKVFAGGDAKLMIALGAVIPFYSDLNGNLILFATFIFLFLISGAIYGIFMGLRITLSNREVFVKDFKKRFVKNKNLFYILFVLGLLIMGVGFFSDVFFLLGIFIFILPYFYIWAKSVDETCMIKRVSPRKLREGDWLYKDIKFAKRTIKAKWDGLTNEEISFLRTKNKEVYIREGIPFTPVFFISFILLLVRVFFLG
jgi:Flp pilus assembly protein protease CpaA